MRKFRYSTMAFAMFCAMAWSTAGEAQSVGSYAGTTSDGHSVNITVAIDGNGKLAVTGVSLGWAAECKSPHPVFNTNWGFGVDAVIKNHKASFAYGTGGGDYFYVPMNFVFSGSSVTGDEALRAAALVPAAKAPSRAEYCTSAKQAYTATFSTATAVLPELPPGAAMRLTPKE